MALSYPKITEEQDLARGILEKGEYNFQVVEIEERPTKKGDHTMLVVDILITHGDRKIKMRDWIVFMEEMAWKFRHFCYSLSLGEKYEDGTIEAKDFLDKKGIIRVGTREYEQDGEKRLANSVVDYVKAKETSANSAEFVDSDIPF